MFFCEGDCSIRKSRDKPIEIHTKEKMKIRLKKEIEIKQKRRKICTIEKLTENNKKISSDKQNLQTKKRKFQNKRRKLKFFLDKMNAQEEQKDSIAKLVRDLVLSKAIMKMKEILPMLGATLLFMTIMVVPIISIIVFIYHSPFAVLFPTVSSRDSVQNVLSGYMVEFQSDIQEELANDFGYHTCEKIFENAEITNNCEDILAVYMVKHGNGQNAVDMTENAKENLKVVFDDMCSYFVSERTETQTDEDGNEQILIIKEVHIVLKEYEDMILEYGFQEYEQNILSMLMQTEYFSMIGSGGVINSEHYQAIVDGISDANGKKVVEYVLSKVGYPYSQAYRDSGNYYDCSSLAYYAWKNAGVSLIYEGANTAAAEGKFCYDNHYLVAYEEMQPGDLIFYSYAKNGRFFNITHVAIYVGDGMVVEAANERIGVVYRKVQSPSSIVFIGRPR